MSANKIAAQAPAEVKEKFVLSKRMVYYLMIILALVWVGFLYLPAISSLILGTLLAYLLHPAAVFLNQKLRLNYTLSVWMIFISFIVILVSLIRYSAPIIDKQIGILTNDFEVISQELINLQPILENLLNISVPLDEVITELEQELNQVLVPNKIFMILRSATSNFVWIMVTLMTCFYLLLEHKNFVSWLIRITPDSQKDLLNRILQEVNSIWKSYLRGQLVLMVIIGLASGVAALVLGIPNALIIGVLAGFLELIPSLGPTVSTIIVGVSAWTQGPLFLDLPNFGFAILVCVIFIAIQTIENIILVPRIMGRRMKLHPALVFIAIISTLTLFGVIAGLIVIPVIASIAAIIKISYQDLNQTMVPDA